MAALTFVLLMLQGPAIAQDATPQVYQRAGTWEATMLATRERFQALQAAQPASPVALSPWFVTAPAPSGNWQESFFPERGVDLEARSEQGVPLWSRREGWVDGQVHNLGAGINTATYLFRTLTSATAARRVASMGSDDSLTVWLNGERVYARDVSRPAAPDQERVELNLRAGENHLLVRIHNYINEAAFYFALGSPLDIAVRDVLPALERDFAAETAEFRADAGGDPLVVLTRFLNQQGAATVESELAGRALSEVGDRAPGLARRLEDLRASGAPAGDPDWLAVYRLACEARSALAQSRRVDALLATAQWLGEWLARRHPADVAEGEPLLRETHDLAALRDRALAALAADETQWPGLCRELAQGRESLEQTSRERLAALILPRLGVRELLVAERYDIECSHVYTINTEGFRAGGALCVVDLLTGAKRTLVESPQGQIMNCDLDWDGRRVVFAWRKTEGSPYHLYALNVDGSGLRQITDGDYADYDPCWLPDGGIAFVTSRAGNFPFCWTNMVGNLYRMEADGSNLRRLSYGMLNDLTPSVLDDGTILYTRWEYIDRGAIPIQSLWTLRPDGTGLQGYFGNRVLDPGTFMHARQVPGTTRTICTLAGHNGPCRGALGLLDPGRGANVQEAITNLTPEVNIGRVDQGNGNQTMNQPYESPVPLDDTFYVCTRRGQLELRDYGGHLVLPLLQDAKGIGLYSPRPVLQRPRPPVLPPTVAPDAAASGQATLYLRDVYEGLGPTVRRGEIRQIMVIEEGSKPVRSTSIEQLNAPGFSFRGPVTSCGAAFSTKTVWGVVDVDEDGSAAFRVPANRPLFFHALDEHGRTIQRMRSFTHLAPGEVQGCVGCHADRNETAPAFTLQRPAAMARVPRDLRPPSYGVRPFGYVNLVQPILDAHCVSCHNPRRKSGGIDLSGDRTDLFNVSYEYLARDNDRRGSNPYTCWIPTENGNEWAVREIAPRRWGSPRAKLADLVISGHPDGEGRPRVSLSEDEKRTVITWIDVNVPYYDTMDTSHPEAPGMRQTPRPPELRALIAEVAQRRGIRLPQRQWERITEPQNSEILCDALSREAGGSADGEAVVFRTTDDPDYQRVLEAWQPFLRELERRPRLDMPGGRPSEQCSRVHY